MERFAQVEDLQARFRELSESEKLKAGTLLDDASSMLQTEFQRAGKQIDPDDELQKVNLKVVACSMVKRVLANGIDGDVTQKSVTAGSYTEQVTFASSTGEMYITKQERRILGIPMRKFRMGSIMPKIGEEDEG